MGLRVPNPFQRELCFHDTVELFFKPPKAPKVPGRRLCLGGRRRRRSSLIIAKNDLKRHARTLSGDATGLPPQARKAQRAPPTHGASQIDAHDTPTQPSSAFMLGRTLSGSPRRLAFSLALPRRHCRWYPGAHTVHCPARVWLCTSIGSDPWGQW